jgi:hypothetical protein
MILSIKTAFIFLGFSLVLLRVAGPCTCNKSDCLNNPRNETVYVSFFLKDKTTGKDIISADSGYRTVPDSIQLKNLVTGQSSPLVLGLDATSETVILGHYQRPANVEDSLVFYFGNSIPDTLVVQTGLVDGWRGDECPTVREPGVTKVTLRGQVLLVTTSSTEYFTIRK